MLVAGQAQSSAQEAKIRSIESFVQSQSVLTQQLHGKVEECVQTIEDQRGVVQGLVHEMSGIEDRLQQSFASHFGAQTARIEELLRAKQSNEEAVKRPRHASE